MYQMLKPSCSQFKRCITICWPASPPSPPSPCFYTPLPLSGENFRQGWTLSSSWIASISDVTSFKDIVIKRDAKIHILWNFIDKDIALVFYIIGKDVLLSWLLNNTKPNFQTHVGSICSPALEEDRSAHQLLSNYQFQKRRTTVHNQPFTTSFLCVFLQFLDGVHRTTIVHQDWILLNWTCRLDRHPLWWPKTKVDQP